MNISLKTLSEICRSYLLSSDLLFPVATNLKQVVGISSDGYHIYWTDVHSERESIVRALEDGSNREVRDFLHKKIWDTLYELSKSKHKYLQALYFAIFAIISTFLKVGFSNFRKQVECCQTDYFSELLPNFTVLPN